MVRLQKSSKKTPTHTRPTPPAVRRNTQRPVFNNNLNNNYAQVQQQHAQQKVQQQAQQEAQQADLLRFCKELEQLQHQEHEQLRHERAIQRRLAELSEEQRQQKLLFQKQQEKHDKHIKQLQGKHERGLQAQARTFEKLLEDRFALQRQLKEQEQQYLLQPEREATEEREAEAKQQKQKVENQAEAEALTQRKLSELSKRSNNKEPGEAATTIQSSTPPSSPHLTEMNGNAAGAGVGVGTGVGACAGAGAASRKPLLRAILGNSAPQRPALDTTLAERANNRQAHPRVQFPGTRSNGGVSVNYRLKQQQSPVATATTASPAGATAVQLITPPDSPENEVSNKTQLLAQITTNHKQNINMIPESNVNNASNSIQPVRQVVNFKFDPACDAILSLSQYCLALGYAPPEYEFYYAIKSTALHCTVRIGESIYTSYPEDHMDEATAKQRASEVAIERLQVLESRKQLSVSSDTEFLDGLYQELLKHPQGIVSHKLAEWYEAAVKQQVPSNCWALINQSPKVRIERFGDNTRIVFANTATGSVQSIVQQTVGPTAMPELQLPWGEGQQDWNMYITHCDNTTQVWARLINQSAEFKKLTEQLNAHMSRLQNRQPVQQQPTEQKIYLVEVSENWNRVRIMSSDAEQRQCSCHFVDFGDEVIFSFDTLYLCPSQFLALPAQAVCLSMYALDKFKEHPHALPVLSKELAGHSVVTRIITSEMQFHKLGGLAQGVLKPQEEAAEENGYARPGVRSACIVGTFYDTSTTEDIHLNDLVANQIILHTPAPMLKLEQKSNQVFVSHVNDFGDLMVQLPNQDLKFVQRSIARIISGSSKQHRVRYSDLLHDHLVCVCEEAGDGPKQWFRGMLTAKPKSPEEEVFDVYYVDDGRLRKTHISNIYRLEANNLALASYPAQALRVRLHDVPPIDDQMVGRLRGLLSPQTPVRLKVMEGTSDKLPMVTIHALGQDNLYLCVNSAIRVEYEVQSTARLEPFDDGGLLFSPNGQLIRRSSFSSSVSSQSSASDQPTATSIASPPATPSKAKGPQLPLLKEYEAIPAVGSYFEVRVTLSVNPGRFAVQPYKCYNQQQRLMKDLQGHCKSPSAQSVDLAQLNIGHAYAAADGDGVYHRVNIRKIYDEMIHVRYVDAGDDGVVRSNQLLQLPLEFRELPMMALPAQLYGIKLTGIDWTQENCVRFRKLTLGQKFIGIVRRVDKLKDERRALSLELIDTSTTKDIKVHETLISEKHAQAAP